MFSLLLLWNKQINIKLLILIFRQPFCKLLSNVLPYQNHAVTCIFFAELWKPQFKTFRIKNERDKAILVHCGSQIQICNRGAPAPPPPQNKGGGGRTKSRKLTIRATMQFTNGWNLMSFWCGNPSHPNFSGVHTTPQTFVGNAPGSSKEYFAVDIDWLTAVLTKS